MGVREELASIFRPSRTPATAASHRLSSGRRCNARGRRSSGRPPPPERKLLRVFCCLAESSASIAPDSDTVVELGDMGLGLKEMEISPNATSTEIDAAVAQLFPALNGIGGFELLRAVPGSNNLLQLRDLTGNYLSSYTRATTRIYVRPIQRDITRTERREVNALHLFEQYCLIDSMMF